MCHGNIHDNEIKKECHKKFVISFSFTKLKYHKLFEREIKKGKKVENIKF